MKLVTVEIGGKKESVLAMPAKNGLWFHYRGETYFFEKSKPARVRKKDDLSGGDIFAPMPGKITKVVAKAGQSVTKKQTLVIMEAMKMEYNLRADAEGVVKKVACTEGEQVSQDQLLVEFEKHES